MPTPRIPTTAPLHVRGLRTGRSSRSASRRATVLAVAVAAAATTVAAAPAAGAQSPRVVDPASVTPALNDAFAPWSCSRTGSGITCRGELDNAFGGPEPIGLYCGDQEVWIVDGGGRESMTRWHDAQGQATRTIVHLHYPADRYALSPDPGAPSVVVRGHWTQHYRYAVPGARDSRVLTQTGASTVVTVPGQGVVLQDTGRVVFAPGQDFEVVASRSGVHDTLEDPAALLRVGCDILT